MDIIIPKKKNMIAIIDRLGKICFISGIAFSTICISGKSLTS
jgi:hypothetical protein